MGEGRNDAVKPGRMKIFSIGAISLRTVTGVFKSFIKIPYFFFFKGKG
jgi:hypothetical protein